MEERLLEEKIHAAIKKWKESQKNQTDGYEYERTFNEMIHYVGREILQESMGEIPKSRKEKKTTDQLWGNNSSKRTRNK